MSKRRHDMSVSEGIEGLLRNRPLVERGNYESAIANPLRRSNCTSNMLQPRFNTAVELQ